jgi:hypothetical protein
MKRYSLIILTLVASFQFADTQTKSKIKPKSSQERIIKKDENRKSLEEDILLAYEEYLIADEELRNALDEYEPYYRNLANPDVAPYARRKDLAARKVRLLLKRYEEKYKQKFDVQKEYFHWKYNRE